MKYIVHRRFRGNAICGPVNLPAKTECECGDDGMICFEGRPICYAESENAHAYFAPDEDGNGLVRGWLTRAICRTLKKQDANHESRWRKVWEDPLCRPYKRTEHKHWLWNHSFFCADVETLRYIARLVGARGGVLK